MTIKMVINIVILLLGNFFFFLRNEENKSKDGYALLQNGLRYLHFILKDVLCLSYL